MTAVHSKMKADAYNLFKDTSEAGESALLAYCQAMYDAGTAGRPKALREWDDFIWTTVWGMYTKARKAGGDGMFGTKMIVHCHYHLR